MTTQRTKLLLVSLALAGSSANVDSSPAALQEVQGAGPIQAEFAAPRKLLAGDAYAGHGRLFPSPVLYDVDGDERADLVIGDLIGKVTWARASPSEPGIFEKEQAFLMRDGEPLKFSNW